MPKPHRIGDQHTSSLPAFPEKTLKRTRSARDVGRDRVRLMLSGADEEADEAANAVNIVSRHLLNRGIKGSTDRPVSRSRGEFGSYQ
jgi:hypothetical protein